MAEEGSRPREAVYETVQKETDHSLPPHTPSFLDHSFHSAGLGEVRASWRYGVMGLGRRTGYTGTQADAAVASAEPAA
ncbi:MAG: hypothetical protein ACPIOQ_74945 [Promethearchaeia archaeon]